MSEAAEKKDFIRVASVDEFGEDRGRMVFYKGTRVAVFRQQGRFYAFNDSCPHMGAALSGGRVCDGYVRCHMHGWEFSVTTGECRTKEWARLPRYEVRVEGRDLLLRPQVDEVAADPEDDLDRFMNWESASSGTDGEPSGD